MAAATNSLTLTEDRFLVEGMDCSACATNIEKAIRKLPGIDRASVSLATGEAFVAFDPASVTLGNIKKAVDRIGYKAVDLPEEHAHHHAEESASLYKQRQIKFFTALALTIPIFIISMLDLQFAGSN